MERLLELVKQGGILVGKRPQVMASLSGGKETEKRFSNPVDAL